MEGRRSVSKKATLPALPYINLQAWEMSHLTNDSLAPPCRKQSITQLAPLEITRLGGIEEAFGWHGKTCEMGRMMDDDASSYLSFSSLIFLIIFFTIFSLRHPGHNPRDTTSLSPHAPSFPLPLFPPIRLAFVDAVSRV